MSGRKLKITRRPNRFRVGDCVEAHTAPGTWRVTRVDRKRRRTRARYHVVPVCPESQAWFRNRGHGYWVFDDSEVVAAAETMLRRLMSRRRDVQAR